MNLRRAYFECRYGQIHVRTAFPSTGGFDERTPLICLHELGRSSGTFEGLLPHIATDRSVYACDLPGFGASDSSAGALGVSDHAAAVADFLGGLRLRTVDVLGVGLGAAVALELAILLDSKIRKLVLVHAPFSSRDLSPVSPVPPAANGS